MTPCPSSGEGCLVKSAKTNNPSVRLIVHVHFLFHVIPHSYHPEPHISCLMLPNLDPLVINPPFKGLKIRIPTILPTNGRGFINQGSGLLHSSFHVLFHYPYITPYSPYIIPIQPLYFPFSFPLFLYNPILSCIIPIYPYFHTW